MQCHFCANEGGEVIWRDGQCRVVRAVNADHPAYCIVVWTAHQREMTDLSPPERDRLLSVVYAVEQALRELLQPEKVNLASLGNLVPHLHWHVIARFRDDRHFPGSIWGNPTRPEATPAPLPADFAPRLGARLRELLAP